MSDAQKIELFDKMLRLALSPDRVYLLVGFFSQATSTPDSIDVVFDGPDRELIVELFEGMTDEEIKEVFRPVMAEMLKEAIGAKNVGIEW